MSPCDHDVIAMIAADESAVVDLAATWRAIAREAIHALAEQRGRLLAQEQAITALREELRCARTDAQRTTA